MYKAQGDKRINVNIIKVRQKPIVIMYEKENKLLLLLLFPCLRHLRKLKSEAFMNILYGEI